MAPQYYAAMRLTGSVENRTTIIGYLAAGLVFGGIGAALFSLDPITGCVFGALGAVLIYGAVHTLVGATRYGDVSLELAGRVVPGGRLMARLACPKGAARVQVLHAEMRCKKAEWTGIGKSRSLSETVLWSAKKSFTVQAVGDAAFCDLDFDMPADAPISEGGSTATQTHPGIFWEVQVESDDLPGVDLMRGFRFPVVPGTPGTSMMMRPKVPLVAPSPEKAAVAAEVQMRYLLASKVTLYAAMAGAAALLGYAYLNPATLTATSMNHGLLALIAIIMGVYWVHTLRNWFLDKAKDPATPPLTGAFIWHMLVFGAIAWQLW